MADRRADPDHLDHDNDDVEQNAGGVADCGRPAKKVPPALVPREQVAAELDRFYAEVLASAPGTLGMLVITPGAGKSHTLKSVMRTAPQRFTVCVPLHSLGAEYAEDLEGSHGGVYVKRSVTAHRTNGERTCLRVVEVDRRIRAGIDPVKRICSSCRYADNHPVADGGACPALTEALRPPEDARIRILQSAKADAVLEALVRKVRGAKGDLEDVDDDDFGADDDSDHEHEQTDAGPPALPMVVIDEPPAMLLQVKLSPSTVRACRDYVDRLRPAVQAALTGVVIPMLDTLEARTLKSGDALLDVLQRAGKSEEVVNLSLKATWNGAPQLAAQAEKHLADEERTERDLSDTAHALAVITVLREAAFEPRRALFYKDEDGSQYLCARAPWVRHLRAYLRVGGRAVLLDATADPRDLRSLGIRSDHKRHPVPVILREIHVADGPGVNRMWLQWASGPKSRHVVGGRVQTKNLRGPLRALARLWKTRPGLLGIIAFKEVAELLRHEVEARRANPDHQSALLPDEFTAMIDDGHDVLVGHYGAHRGLNSWSTATVMATLGDPFPNLASIRAEAQTLKRHPEARFVGLREAERNQATGRGRPIWGGPKLVVHVGKFRPVNLRSPQWVGAQEIRPERGGQTRKLPAEMSIEEHEAARARLGLSMRRYAERIGVAPNTYSRKTKAVTGLVTAAMDTGVGPRSWPSSPFHPARLATSAGRHVRSLSVDVVSGHPGFASPMVNVTNECRTAALERGVLAPWEHASNE